MRAYTKEDDPIELSNVLRRRQEPGVGRYLSRADMIEFAVKTTEHGMSARRISQVLTVTPRTVHRWRKATGATRKKESHELF